MKPMLAMDIQPSQFQAAIDSDDWMLEQKVDGERRLVQVVDGQVTPFNRRGERTTLPPAIQTAFALGDGPWTFDGELIGTTMWLFDLVEAPNGLVTPTLAAYGRRMALNATGGVFANGPVRILPCWTERYDKRRMALDLYGRHAEGLIFRQCDGVYTGGKAPQLLRLKFTRDVDCVVTAVGLGGRHNMAVALYDAAGYKVPVGEVGANSGDGEKIVRMFREAHPGEQIVVTVKYLYASNDRRLVQATRPRLRTDKAPEECTVDQLVYVNREVLDG